MDCKYAGEMVDTCSMSALLTLKSMTCTNLTPLHPLYTPLTPLHPLYTPLTQEFIDSDTVYIPVRDKAANTSEAAADSGDALPVSLTGTPPTSHTGTIGGKPVSPTDTDTDIGTGMKGYWSMSPQQLSRRQRELRAELALVDSLLGTAAGDTDTTDTAAATGTGTANNVDNVNGVNDNGGNGDGNRHATSGRAGGGSGQVGVHEAVTCGEAALPLGHYSQAVRAGDTLYVCVYIRVYMCECVYGGDTLYV